MTKIPTKPFRGKRPGEKNDWKEDHIQQYIVQESRRAGYMMAGSLEGQYIASAKARAKAQSTGRTAGEPDMRFYLQGRIVFIELKKEKGKLSKTQKEYHEALRGKGFQVETVYAKDPWDGWLQVYDILQEAK